MAPRGSTRFEMNQQLQLGSSSWSPSRLRKSRPIQSKANRTERRQFVAATFATTCRRRSIDFFFPVQIEFANRLRRNLSRSRNARKKEFRAGQRRPIGRNRVLAATRAKKSIQLLAPYLLSVVVICWTCTCRASIAALAPRIRAVRREQVVSRNLAAVVFSFALPPLLVFFLRVSSNSCSLQT